MSFYTSFFCYRGGPAPERVTGRKVAAFLQQFGRIGACEGAVDILNLKFGGRIDQDASSTVAETPTDVPEITIAQDIKWDVELKCASLLEAVVELTRFDQPIRQAIIELGGAPEALSRLFERPPCEENDRS